MIGAAQAARADWRLIYGGRRADSMAFRSELETYGDRVSFRPQDVAGLLDVPAILGDLAPGTVVYCCGPEALLTAVEQQCDLRPSIALRVERFAAKKAGAPARSDTIDVILRRSGLTLEVPPDRSILEVITAAGIDAAYSCQGGVCGSCETRVLGGDPDHRDSVLDPDEQAAGNVMMICVSRSRGPWLELDL
jgi:ferredoxin